MNILAIIVTYFPEKDLLVNNIAEFVDYVDKILIWENTPPEEKMNYRYIKDPKIEYCGDGINSISRGLNFAWKYAIENGFDYLLTMDQDSLWQCFDEFVKNIVEGGVPYGLWGPVINKSIQSSYLEVPALITSGMLVHVKILNLIGGYDERFDIDGIDTDLCYRAKTYGVASYVINKGMLIQRFGNPFSYCFLGVNIYMPEYSPTRRFFVAKSKAMLLRKYRYGKLNVIKVIIVELFLKSYYIMMGEKNKTIKIMSIFKGFFAGLFEKNLGYVNKTVKVL